MYFKTKSSSKILGEEGLYFICDDYSVSLLLRVGYVYMNPLIAWFHFAYVNEMKKWSKTDWVRETD